MRDAAIAAVMLAFLATLDQAALTQGRRGAVAWQFGQVRPFQQAPPVSLTAGQTLTADIPLTRGGAISGRVYDASGDSLGGLHVRVYRATMEQGMRRLKAVGVADLTDDTGAFRVYGLPPGDYFVAATLRVAPIDSVVETTYTQVLERLRARATTFSLGDGERRSVVLDPIER